MLVGAWRGICAVYAYATAIAPLLTSPSEAHAATAPQYRLRASVSLTAPQVDGTVEVAFTNTSGQTLHDAVFFLFPNRFSVPDAGVNDFNRPFIYPEEDFDPGGLRVLEAREGDALTTVETVPCAGLPDGTVARVPIAPLQPGAVRKITLRFQT